MEPRSRRMHTREVLLSVFAGLAFGLAGPAPAAPPASVKEHVIEGDRSHLSECRMAQHRIREMDGYELKSTSISGWLTHPNGYEPVNGIKYVWQHKKDGTELTIDVGVFGSPGGAAHAADLRLEQLGRAGERLGPDGLRSMPPLKDVPPPPPPPAKVAPAAKTKPAAPSRAPAPKSATPATGGKTVPSSSRAVKPGELPSADATPRPAAIPAPAGTDSPAPGAKALYEAVSPDGAPLGEKVWSRRVSSRESHLVFLRGRAVVCILIHRPETATETSGKDPKLEELMRLARKADERIAARARNQEK